MDISQTQGLIQTEEGPFAVSLDAFHALKRMLSTISNISKEVDSQ
jgi:hypothetical protein